MKKGMIGLLAVTLALPGLAAPPAGTWESMNGDFAAGGWSEVLVGGSGDAVGNALELAGDVYQLTGATVSGSVLAETGFDFVRYDVTLTGGVLTLANLETAPWFDPANPEAAFTVTLASVSKSVVAFTDPMGRPTGESRFTVRAEGAAADDPSVTVVFEAGFSGPRMLDESVVPAVQSGALEWASLTVTRASVPVVVDIKPGSDANPVNLTSRGVIPVAILGSVEFDVSQIDVTTIRLEGVAPVRWSAGDVSLAEPEDGVEAAGDGFADLKLKFRTAQLAAVLGDLPRNSRVELTLTAQLLDGTAIEGTDSIRVLKSNRPSPKPAKPLKPKKAKKNGN